MLLKEAWNPEQSAMGNSTLPTVSDKLNVMASIHNRKLIATLAKELKAKDCQNILYCSYVFVYII